MIRPTMALAMEKTKTAAALRSLAMPAKGCLLGETRSTNFSRAVLSNSRLKTPAIQSNKRIHSKLVTWQQNPKVSTARVEAMCNLKLRSFQAKTRPWKANLKDCRSGFLDILRFKINIVSLILNKIYYFCVMKRLVFIGSFLALAFSACEEIPPYIDFTKPTVSKDTTYVASVIPAAQHKAVLIEDITGVRCNNCPNAAQKALDILAQKSEDSVVVMSLYSGDYNVTFTAPWPGFINVNSVYSGQVINQLGIPNALPNGYIDRTKFGVQTVRFNAYPNWPNLVNQRLRSATPVNIKLEKTLSGRSLTVKMKLEYNSASSNNHKYSLFITESGIVSKQTTLTAYDDNYVHNHVLRYAFGNAVGNALNAPLVAGRTFEKLLDFEVPADYNLAKCHIVCVVSDATTEEVINVRQIDL